ncbi:(p)ppGpp synthetase [Mediterraneibacter glycyrrhizinilyticus]|uniref:GTP pyrophosphokinase n=1 Tax=Mediterraneibacter glycyrrhizinilyticus TaxID=342942 RepID=UPI0019620435|nr:(p)ppGpp synthetase [Mediterraneibacter glycyrrhizinilyticus]MBM6750907.1 (p)ppGpp synthetase [Mediterraneibacter glycyrrhizinilyticus]
MTLEEYYELIKPYTDAMNLILTRLGIMDHDTYEKEDFRPIHSITNRIKEKESIENKLRKKGSSGSVPDAKALLKDIAGIRVVCFFEQDIRHLVGSLKKQADLILIREKDYIKTPKPNGYRSYHIIVGVPTYYMNSMEYYPVEIQFRTISMDLWAAMEHRICYKAQPFNEIEMRNAFRQYSEILEKMEKSFEVYSENNEVSV